ncbi:MAG: DUF4215 domain-containing protein [Myxococcota bacterium]
MKRNILSIQWSVLPAFVLAVAGCSGGPAEETSDTGSVGVSLQFDRDTAPAQLGYKLEGHGVERAGSLSADAEEVLRDLPPGEQYALEVVGLTEDGGGCQGHVDLDVAAGQRTNTTIPVYCTGDRPAGRYNQLGEFFRCPILGGAVVYPAEIDVGDKAWAIGPAVLSRNATYSWSSTGAGEFSNPNSILTKYTCTQEGVHRLTVTATAGSGCSKSLTVKLTCGEPAEEPECGNGVIEEGEECDDGNTEPGDGCDENCQIEEPQEPECGNGIIEEGEQCDDGNTEPGDGCDENCQIEEPEPECGNGVVEGDETCDGDCPTSCDDGNPCTTDTMEGSPETCDVVCINEPITECADDDGCCPSGCDATTDSDCSSECGNGVIEPGETCDGNCPTECDDDNACTTDELIGSPETCDAVCENTPITECVDGDGCCPSGCDATNDDDCSATCGNGVVEPGETCDGDCPTECDDGDACTTDTLTGSAEQCSAECTFSPITACMDGDGCCPSGCDATNDADCAAECGNGVVEPGETCDGNCPTDCDDGNSCTTDTLTGSPEECNVMCENEPITECVDGDGCCAPGCDATNDDDCSPTCGNGVVEPGETCDGDCPTSCDDGDVCTTDTLSGSAEECSAQCTHMEITVCESGDGCCPSGCDNTNDDDCSPTCGNGVVEMGEECDDGNTEPGDGCDENCQVEEPEGVTIPGTWISQVQTTGEMEVPIVGSVDAEIELVIRLYVEENEGNFDTTLDICDLQTTSTPDPTTLEVTYTQEALDALSETISVPAFTVDVGDPVPFPDFTILAGQDEEGNPVDADGDGNPGVTLPSSVASGLIVTDAYVGLTLETSLDGVVDAEDTITGSTDFSTQGEVFGDSAGALPVGGSINVVPADSPVDFSSTRLDGNVPCSEVVTMF